MRMSLRVSAILIFSRIRESKNMLRQLYCSLLIYCSTLAFAVEVNPMIVNSPPALAKAPALIAPVPTSSLNTGANLINTCAACHGVEGNSQPGQAPKLAGQNKTYLLKQLRDYKKGEAGGREDAIMIGIAATLTETQMVEVADYYAKQTTQVGSVAPQYVTLGQKIYRAGLLEKGVPACSACHSPNGAGNAEAGFPKLSGQLPAYIIESLNEYKNKSRSNDSNHIMQDIAARLSQEEVTAVANYVYGLE